MIASTDHPRLTVIVPVYNAAPYLPACLDSLLAQTLREMEILCINDGSTDGSASILAAYAARDGRMRIVEQANRGAAAARNTALGLVRGDYVGIVDADDHVAPDYFAKLLDAAIRHDAPVAATSRVFNESEGGSLRRKNTGLAGTKSLLSKISDKGRIIIATGITWNKIYRSDFIRNNGIRFLEIRTAAEDNYFTARAVILAEKIAVIHDAAYYYRQIGTALTKTEKSSADAAMTEIYRQIDSFIKGQGFDAHSEKKWLHIVNTRKIKDFRTYLKWMPEALQPGFLAAIRTVFPDFPLARLQPGFFRRLKLRRKPV